MYAMNLDLLIYVNNRAHKTAKHKTAKHKTSKNRAAIY